MQELPFQDILDFRPNSHGESYFLTHLKQRITLVSLIFDWKFFNPNIINSQPIFRKKICQKNEDLSFLWDL